MGSFDTVVTDCPNCGRMVEFQSKAGACTLNRFHSSSVPVVIAVDLDLEVGKCLECGTKVALTYPHWRVSMGVRSWMALAQDAESYD